MFLKNTLHDLRLLTEYAKGRPALHRLTLTRHVSGAVLAPRDVLAVFRRLGYSRADEMERAGRLDADARGIAQGQIAAVYLYWYPVKARGTLPLCAEDFGVARRVRYLPRELAVVYAADRPDFYAYAHFQHVAEEIIIGRQLPWPFHDDGSGTHTLTTATT